MRRFKIVATLVTIMAGLMFTGSAFAQERSWTSITHMSVRGTTVESDILNFYKKNLRFSHLRVQAVHNGVYLRRVVVEFGNREKQRFTIDQLLDQGDFSPIMDLIGPTRRIRTILLEYVSRSPGVRKSSVKIEGARRAERADPGREPTSLEVVGQRRFRRGRARTTIAVDDGAGPITEIALRSADYRVRVRSVEVFFANGQSDRAIVNQRIDRGERTGTIEFDRPRRVTKIEVTITPRLGQRQPTISVLARHDGRRGGGRGDGGGRVQLPSNWDRIARQRLTSDAGTETIKIGTRKGRFKNLRLRSLDSSIFVSQIVAVYGNGKRRRIPVYNELPAPGMSRPIRLNGWRGVDSIEVTYSASPYYAQYDRGNARSVIEVYGETSRAATARPRRDTSPPPRQHGDAGEWVLLGTRKASLFNRDTDVFRVGRDAGRFKKIRVVAKKHDIRMYGMRITYGNGNAESVGLYGTLEDGTTSPAFDLKGRHRFIDSIAFQYRTKLNFKGQGSVELWGLRAN